MERFASRSVSAAFAQLFKRYRENSDFTNHCIVKMFHRIAFDCKLPALLFQVKVIFLLVILSVSQIENSPRHLVNIGQLLYYTVHTVSQFNFNLQVCVFRGFQKIGQDRKVLRGNKGIEELYKFGKYLLSKTINYQIGNHSFDQPLAFHFRKVFRYCGKEQIGVHGTFVLEQPTRRNGNHRWV